MESRAAAAGDLCYGEDYDDDFWRENGHVEVNFGFEHFFTGHAGLLGVRRDSQAPAQSPEEARFLEAMAWPENLERYQDETQENIRKLLDWIRQIEKAVPVERVRLWSEGEENFEARIEEILAARSDAAAWAGACDPRRIESFVKSARQGPATRSSAHSGIRIAARTSNTRLSAIAQPVARQAARRKGALRLGPSEDLLPYVARYKGMVALGLLTLALMGIVGALPQSIIGIITDCLKGSPRALSTLAGTSRAILHPLLAFYAPLSRHALGIYCRDRWR